MTNDVLAIMPDTLLVFIDETGNEPYGDPKNPTFGRGGCAILSADYKRLIKRPWRKMKREKMGGAAKQFHATEFEQSRPTKRQITAINRFLQQPFWRFAAMSDAKTDLPPGIDGHRTISLVTVNFVRKMVATYKDIATVALVFEAFGRDDKLVKRDFDLANIKLPNGSGKPFAVESCFMEKKYMEPGLEIDDLIVHTAGRQRRHQMAGKEGVVKDFEQTYWHSPIPPAFMAIDTVRLNELAIEDRGGDINHRA